MRIAEGRSVGRGQAIQLGALLLFAILIINLSLFQAFVVPNQNGEIEFKHSQQVQEELETARSLAQQAVATDTELSTSIQLGPQYPSRTLFVNPAPPAGTVETIDRGDIVVTNAEPTASETAQAWDETGEAFATKALAYRPGYNYYDNAPTTVYDTSVLYNVQPDGTVRSRTGQTLVSGNRITLVAMSGSMGTSGSGAETIEFQPASAPTQRVPIEPTGSGDFTVALETQIPENVWRNQLLAGEIDGSDSDPNAYIESIDCSASDPDDPCGTLTLTFENSGDETYSLRLGEVGIGDNVDDEPESYITRVDPTTESLSVTEGSRQEITVEVRDRYNNPVSGVTVQVDDPSGAGSVTSGDDRTDERGQANFVYDATNAGSETLTFAISSPNSASDPEKVEYDVTVNSDSGDGTPPNVSGASASPSTISTGQSFDLSATFDDTSGRGGSDVFSATWMDTVSSDSGDMVASDDQFDQAVESVETTVGSTGDWTTGDHDIEITGTDANGNSRTATVTVTVTSGPVPANLPTDIVYLDSNGGDQGDIQSVPDEVTYPTNDQVKGLGPLESDLDGDDDAKEIPYVDNNDKRVIVVDSSGNRRTLMDDIQAREKRMAVGDIDADGRTEVLFVGNANDRLRQVDHADGGTSSEIMVGGTPVPASQIVGYEDLNGDGDRDIVYVDDDDILSYIDDGSTMSTGYEPNSNAALGQPADLDDDGELELPAVNDNGSIELVTASGAVEQTITTSAASAPLATVQDLTGDGVPDVAFVRSNNNKIEVISATGDGSVSYNEKANANYGAN
jgi:hypothetical protein